MNNSWLKQGCILEASEKNWWMSHYCGPAFVDVINDELIMYVVGRDKYGVSRIGIVKLDPNEPTKVLSTSADPILDVGLPGCFDESGVSYPWLFKHDNDIFLYFVGWQAGGLGGFQTNIGLAKYDHILKEFIRVSRAPIIDRIDEEPICTGSLSVKYTNDHYRMWYTCFDRWEHQAEESSYKHFYRILTCTSKDGVNWDRPGKVAIDFSDENNHVIAKPQVISENGIHRMWYSYRGDTYQIGYAESHDLVNWVRKDCEFQFINKLDNGFDSEMQEYAFIFDVNNKRYMVYNGNGYGKSGVGLAELME